MKKKREIGKQERIGKQYDPAGRSENTGYTALSGTSVENVYVPASCERIGSRAFKHCPNLRSIHFAGAATVIAADAFKDCVNPVIIYAPNGSAAQNYAQSNGMPWIVE